MFIYILWSESRSQFYVGHTANIEERLARHNDGRSKSTASGRPWRIVFAESFASRSEAMAREREIKSWKSARTIRELIDEHPG